MSASTSSGKNWQPPGAEELSAVLPQYQITELLGRGGMGAVYRGMQISLEREVAVKILPPVLSDGERAARFRNEAMAMARLNHPAIVKVFDSGETADGLLYIVMEFIRGGDILQLMQQHGGRLPAKDAVAITAHVCDALHAAHERGILHRDIKPANILLAHDGAVKVADFGLAKLTQEDSVALTRSGGGKGTHAYMAPETLTLGAEVDHRADVYALGVTFYEMLAGRLPRGLFQPPSEIVPGLDPRYDEIVRRALRDDRALRFASAEEMRHALDELITGPVLPQQAVPATARPRPPAPTLGGKRPRRAAWAYLLILPLLGLAAWWSLKLAEKPVAEPATQPKAESPLEAPKPVQPPQAAPAVAKPAVALFPLPSATQPNVRCSVRVFIHVTKFEISRVLHPEAIIPSGLDDVVMIEVGGTFREDDNHHCVALRADGTVQTWGDNSAGQCDVPPGITNAVEVAAGSRFTAILKADGTCSAWGMVNESKLAPPSLPEKIVHIAAGEKNLLMLTENGRVFIAGDDDRMKSGEQQLPARALALGVCRSHAIALLEDGRLWEWGWFHHPAKSKTSTHHENAEQLQPRELAWNHAAWKPENHDRTNLSVIMNHEFVLTPDQKLRSLYTADDQQFLADEARPGKSSLVLAPLDELQKVIALSSGGDYRRQCALTPAGWVVWGEDMDLTARNVPGCIDVKYTELFGLGLVPRGYTPPPGLTLTPTALRPAESAILLPSAHPPPELTALLASTREEHQKSHSLTAPLTTLRTTYLRELQAREQMAKAQANLRLQALLLEEMRLLTSGQPVPEEPDLTLHADLAQLRRSFLTKAALLKKGGTTASTPASVLIPRLSAELQKLDTTLGESRAAEAEHVKACLRRLGSQMTLNQFDGPQPAPVPSAADAFGGHRYLYVPGIFHWDEARQKAAEMGGTLACIESAEENQWITQTYGKHLPLRLARIWLGGSKLLKTQTWNWVNGDPMTYTAWHPGEPNGTSFPNYLCLCRMSSTSSVVGWNDVSDTRSDLKWCYGMLIEWSRGE